VTDFTLEYGETKEVCKKYKKNPNILFLSSEPSLEENVMVVNWHTFTDKTFNDCVKTLSEDIIYIKRIASGYLGVCIEDSLYEKLKDKNPKIYDEIKKQVDTLEKVLYK